MSLEQPRGLDEAMRKLRDGYLPQKGVGDIEAIDSLFDRLEKAVEERRQELNYDYSDYETRLCTDDEENIRKDLYPNAIGKAYISEYQKIYLGGYALLKHPNKLRDPILEYLSKICLDK